MTKHAVEARVHRRLDNAGGVYVTFQIHPDDTTAVDGVRVGNSVILAWEDVANTKVEKIELPENRAAQGGISAVATQAETPRETKPRRNFHELALSQQAALRCDGDLFQRFIFQTGRSLNNPAEYVRAYCGVASRAELDHDQNAAQRWRELEGQYQTWLVDTKYAESVR